MTYIRIKIKVKGLVQGVGFRPFVFNLARSLDLKGFVKNTSAGVVIEIEGKHAGVFLKRLRSEKPELSDVESIDVESIVKENPPRYGRDEFRIVESEDNGSITPVSPDISVCKDCLSELLDPPDRRYLYPFINCTNCGPRYSITRAIPYDRPNTTMLRFRMCHDCSREYHNPEDRRFHAQANSCPLCGPRLDFQSLTPVFKEDEGENPIYSAIKVLKAGGIVALKGLGGFHIACDAENADAVSLLRERKQRINKPFAIMAPDIDTVRGFCYVRDDEAQLMLSRRRPIVLLNKRPDCRLPEEVAPKNRCLGFMLPYTPLHHLLFFYPGETGTPNFRCLVMTSGNLSEEPIIHENEAAIEGLAGIADAFLLHNRDIFMRVDDSVIRSNVFIRRSRGYVPEAIAIKENGPEVLGVGADLKNTFTLTRDFYAIPSQHIGDMGNFETLKFFEETLENLKKLYRINPVAIAYDMHPGYYSTRWAESQPLEGMRVQHHHAHVASVMAEAGFRNEVIGVVLDGSGYGTDGNIWGSEFLIADLKGFKRLCHFNYMALPGGEMAIREPWRIALGWLQEATGGDALRYIERVGFLNRYGEERIKNVLRLVELPEFTPYSSGAGRLFDAVAAITGIADTNTYEAEAATALESCAAEGITEDYPVDIKFADPMVVDFSFTLLRILEDMTSGTDRSIISARFHNTIITTIIRVVNKLHILTGIRDVVISGGVFQNLYIAERVFERLQVGGFRVHCNRRMPPNDANISLGQAYILRERLRQ